MQPFRLRLENLARADFPEPPGISRVMAVDFLVELLSRQPNLFRIDDDQTASVIRVWRVVRRIFADQHLRSPCRQPPQHPTLCVYDVPANLPSTRLGEISPHSTLRLNPQVTNLYL